MLSVLLGNTVSYGQAWYSSKKFMINTFVPENQVRQIEKDKNGFYWILSSSGRLLRWNGNNNFKVMNLVPGDTASPTHFGLCRADRKGHLYLDEISTGRYYVVDDNSNIRLMDTTKMIIPRLNYVGNFTSPEESWSEIIKNNDPALAEEFRQAMNNSDGTRYPLNYSVDGHAFYLIRNDHFLYYEKGKIAKVQLPKAVNNYALMVGKYLFYISGARYFLYDKEKQIGEDELPGTFSFNNFDNFSYQNYYTPDATFTFFGKTIYKLSVEKNKLIRTPYFTISPDQPPLSCIFIDEVNQRIITSDISGGFVLYTRNFYYYQGDPNPGAHSNTVYALLHTKNRIYISYDFFSRRTKDEGPPIDWHAPPYQLKSGDFLYPSAVEILLFDKNLRVKKSWSGPGNGIVQSVVEMNGRIFYTGADLYEYLPDKMAIDTIHLRISPKADGLGLVKVLAKGPPGILYASIGNDIYEIKLSDYTARGILKRPTESTQGYVKDLRYDAEYGVLFLSLRGQLCYIDPREGKIRYFPLNGNRDLLSCHYMLRDNDGDCWLPTNTGLFFLSKENLQAFVRGGSKQLAYVPANIGQKGKKEEFNSGYSSSGVCVGDSIYLSSMSGVVIFTSR
ncbi:MAG: hypothetical protein NTW29_17520 [Bacteroidetes bacterium]|nr:hypothetical protein [Bacteroidota bacterium]